ncbi:MAG: lipopolysaccharide heptosyltransferase II [Deltaproteobacteria bacterium]|nr:lipopolysaccharide heptosyltransferase II [Deltaproteobacteria bacterium]
MDDQGKGEKILVVQTSFLGDAVLTTPLLAEIRRRFPDAELAVLCTPQAKSLLDKNPDVHEIITDDKKGGARGWIGLWRKAKDLRRRDFTIALSPHKSFRSGLLLFLAGIPYRIGFRQSAGWFFYHCRVNRDSTLHDVKRNLSILEPFGIDPGECQRDLRVEVDHRARDAVERVFRSVGIERNGMTFGLSPGSVWPTKRWSAEGYAELMVHLKQRYSCQILLFGSPEDHEIVTKIQEYSGNIGVSLVGKIALRELACALDWCDVFITNDSGPMHIAVARGIPVVTIFCATTPSLGFYPYSSRAVIVEKDLPCRPCSSHGGRRCPLTTEDCIRLIKAEDVLRGVERLLERKEQVSPVGADPHLPEFITL